MQSKLPNPGSEEARAMGCTCPIFDNNFGKGYLGQEGVFVYNMACPIHKSESEVECEKKEKFDVQTEG